MKTIHYILIACLYATCAQAQVGINLGNPQTIFHIDAGSNNSTTGLPTSTQQLDDFVITTDNNGSVNVGIGIIPSNNSNTQLQLAATNKALLLNRVSLASMKDLLTVPNPTAGMFVYNTSTAGIYPNNVIPGIYYFNGQVWSRIETGSKTSASNMRDLVSNTKSIQTTSINNGIGVAAKADFGTIKITEQGVYTFSLRLYGLCRVPTGSTSTANFTRSTIYLYLTKNAGNTAADVIDMFEINTPLFKNNVAFTYTALLRGEFEKNDIVNIKIAHYGTFIWELYNNPGLRANKTSLIFWQG
jgi:hypothetical protein